MRWGDHVDLGLMGWTSDDRVAVEVVNAWLKATTGHSLRWVSGLQIGAWMGGFPKGFDEARLDEVVVHLDWQKPQGILVMKCGGGNVAPDTETIEALMARIARSGGRAWPVGLREAVEDAGDALEELHQTIKVTPREIDHAVIEELAELRSIVAFARAAMGAQVNELIAETAARAAAAPVRHLEGARLIEQVNEDHVLAARAAWQRLRAAFAS